ncbi:MAG TPA: alpha/beta hydrolase [Thermoplasmata archaeon]|nr:alpha/beta hydrolase [Thermoplasmata archaeon]
MVAHPSPERGDLAVPGGKIAYEVAGAGPPVLLVHSAIADRRLWDREFPRLAEGHRAIRFDLRGYGGSTPAAAPFRYVDDVQALCRHLGVERPFLVGSSMGGAHAIDYALEHPDAVAGLLLVAPGLSGGVNPPFDATETAAFEFDDRTSQEIAARWSQGDAPGAFEGLRALWCAATTGANLELFRRMVESNAPEVYADRSARHATRSPPAEPRLGELRVPATVLVGDRDNPSSPIFAQRIARSIPGAHLTTIAGADHLINLSRPAEFDRALDAALRSVR